MRPPGWSKAITNISRGWGVGHSATAALINAMTTQPSITLVRAIDDLIIGLDDDGWWDEIGYLLIPTLHTEADSLIDWKNPGRRGSNTTSTTWAQYQGFTGNGTTMVINAGTGASGVSGYAQDTAHSFIWVEDGSSTANVFGTATGAAASVMTINPRNSSGNFLAEVNRATSVTVGAVAARNGLFHTRRTVNAEFHGYRNGALVATVANVADATQSGGITLLRDGSTFSNDRFIAFGMGGSSVADPADLYSRLGTFFTAIGTTHS